MAFANVGAYVGNSRPKTKKDLKTAISDNPDSVYFDITSAFNVGSGGYSLSEIPETVKLSVVGPDPYTKRSWYATVSVENGKVKIT